GGVLSTNQARLVAEGPPAGGLEWSLMQGLLQITIVTQPVRFDLTAGTEETGDTAAGSNTAASGWRALTTGYFSDVASVYSRSVDCLFSTTDSLLTFFNDWLEHLPLATPEPVRRDDAGGADLGSDDPDHNDTKSMDGGEDSIQISASYDWRWASAVVAL